MNPKCAFLPPGLRALRAPEATRLSSRDGRRQHPDVAVTEREVCASAGEGRHRVPSEDAHAGKEGLSCTCLPCGPLGTARQGLALLTGG